MERKLTEERIRHTNQVFNTNQCDNSAYLTKFKLIKGLFFDKFVCEVVCKSGVISD